MRQLASIQKIAEIRQIEGADKIVKVRVKDWWIVTQKDSFKEGDWCVFYEIDSFLPIEPLYNFLLKGSKPKKMLVDGVEREGIRLKTIKLRGQLSQGLVLPLAEVLPTVNEKYDGPIEGLEVSELLNVIKYEAPIPADLQGKVLGSFPSFIPKTDEERIQNMAEVLCGWYVTEKLDGTSVTFYKHDGHFGVCSRNQELLETPGNTQWKIARELGLPDKLPDNFAVQGELVGEKIQGNPLKITGQKVYFFNAYNIATGAYLPYKDLIVFCVERNLTTVPVLDPDFNLPKTTEELLKCADGKSQINPEVLREGIVVRPKAELTYKGQRLSFKAISNEYLLKNDL